MTTPPYDSPEEAERAFYASFEARDIDAMMRVWADRDDVVCVHPMGDRLTGRRDIEMSWRQIFGGDGELTFDIADPVYVTGTDISVHFVYEDIRFGPGPTDRSRVLATNTYVRGADGWRLLSHHGSPGVAVRRANPAPGTTVH